MYQNLKPIKNFAGIFLKQPQLIISQSLKQGHEQKNFLLVPLADTSVVIENGKA